MSGGGFWNQLEGMLLGDDPSIPNKKGPDEEDGTKRIFTK